MKVKYLILAAGLALVTACGQSAVDSYQETSGQSAGEGSASDVAIKIVGSSTVAPFATTVAEQFGASSLFPTPIVETTGTGGGFKAFCQGIGADQPSISNASRPIKASERELCKKAGITELAVVRIGFDGIVIANARSGASFDLSKRDIYTALADELPDGQGGFMKNPNKMWSDVNPALPALKIQVFGPPPTSGTRDAFVELAMEKGALDYPALKALKSEDKAAFKSRAHTLRTDGAWIDAGENDTQIVQTLVKNPDALGIFGYSFLEENADRVKGAMIGGIAPTFENIADGSYGISRSMYFYVKKQNLPLVQGVEAYIDEFTSEGAWGPDGYLAEKGLIPLPDADRAAERAHALALETMP